MDTNQKRYFKVILFNSMMITSQTGTSVLVFISHHCYFDHHIWHPSNYDINSVYFSNLLYDFISIPYSRAKDSSKGYEFFLWMARNL